MKRNLLIIFGVVGVAIFISILIVGINRSNDQVEKVKIESKEYAKVQAREEKELEQKEKEAAARKIQQEKELYEKHKGEKLVYSPMGDSLAEGSFATTKDKRYVNVLAQLIEKNLGYDVEVQDGVTKSGSGLKNQGVPNVSKIVKEAPDLVTIEFGVNDANEQFKDVYSNPDDFKKRLSYVIDTIREKSNKDVHIILLSTWNNGQKSMVYNATIGEVAEEKKVPAVNLNSVWQYRSDTFGPKGKKTFNGTSDDWHPNDKGHKEIAERTFEVAKEELK